MRKTESQRGMDKRRRLREEEKINYREEAQDEETEI